ncbi:MAG: glycosyltransferase family 2 protein [Alcaligenaceae bacterium]|nr:MAG: glycosyltransferase family 2 protein [Alcaligenaceae bacterium]
MFSSTSWRVTRPLRWAGLQAQKIKRLRRILPAAIDRHGGIGAVAKRAIDVYSESGVAGLKRAAVGLEMQADTGEPSYVGAPGYATWIARYDTVDDSSRAEMRRRIDAMPMRPLISIVMPTYNANSDWLRAAIESVRGQVYPHWQLCIADDASTSVEVRKTLSSYADDERIKVFFRPVNGHIVAASNSALEMATGDWIALMDHDDLLSEHALFWVADCINAKPDARLIYSDEDKIDESGRRSDPYFKCDWNIDLFYSHNMFSHLGVFDSALVRDVGGFQVGMQGSQDWDLVLRCLEKIEPSQVAHVPRVLYHWRVHAESTAQSADAKPYAALAGERALNEHFQRTGIRAAVEYIGSGYRVRYELPMALPLVSLIIPTRNALELTRQCISSIVERTTYSNYEIILVDNGSDDLDALAYFKTIETASNIRVVRDDGAFNYAAINNRAVALAKGEFVALVNNDIEVISPEWLTEMVSIALQPQVGAVGARLWYPNKTLQHGGVVLGIGGVASHSHKLVPQGNLGYFGRASLIQSFSAVTAACLVVRKNLYERVGGLDEKNLKVAYNDVDFCLRLREIGFRNVWTPYAQLFHHESATRGSDLTEEGLERLGIERTYMLQRWGNLLQYDPAYSPNLTLDGDDFSYAWPPRIEILSDRV